MRPSRTARRQRGMIHRHAAADVQVRRPEAGCLAAQHRPVEACVAVGQGRNEQAAVEQIEPEAVCHVVGRIVAEDADPVEGRAEERVEDQLASQVVPREVEPPAAGLLLGIVAHRVDIEEDASLSMDRAGGTIIRRIVGDDEGIVNSVERQLRRVDCASASDFC